MWAYSQVWPWQPRAYTLTSLNERTHITLGPTPGLQWFHGRARDSIENPSENSLPVLSSQGAEEIQLEGGKDQSHISRCHSVHPSGTVEKGFS